MDSSNIQLYDISGAEEYSNLVQSHILIANAAILVFDVTNRRSFDLCFSKWLMTLRSKSVDADLRSCTMIIGNCTDKIDKNSLVQDIVTEKEMSDKARRHGINLLARTSSKDSTGINEAFNLIISRMNERYKTTNEIESSLSCNFIPFLACATNSSFEDKNHAFSNNSNNTTEESESSSSLLNDNITSYRNDEDTENNNCIIM
jgi:GTPase SAR1 family protein